MAKISTERPRDKIPPMMQTLYRTKMLDDLAGGDRPEDFANAEYRQLLLKSSRAASEGPYILQVNQGWFDERGKTAIHPRTLIEEHFATWELARNSFDVNLARLVEQGYVHSYSFDPESEGHHRYEALG